MTNPTPNTQTAPEGYVMNAKGHYVPLSAVKEIDRLRDDVVQDIISRAKELRSQMIGVKDIMFSNFYDFVELSAREYDTKIGGQKGNVALMSFDGKYKVQMAVQDNIVFDERLQVAKSLIDECLNEWTQGSDDKIKAIINNAFDVDKEGKINTRRVLSLRSLDINDEKWLQAMDAISDAIQVVSSKEYIRVYERDNDGKYQQITLDFASL